ncbi:MAG: Gfo/Idh/MocA family oxidoreductase [Bifidobacteriaceae bacterium]|jgi:predicted dehydrogenase|nr:Gfo/Idh/MocA family oxidoreductase [Bifidobacteriaceae bacterium]
MNKLRVGILAPSEIAFRRFLPALHKVSAFEYAGVAVANESEWFGDAVTDDEKADRCAQIKVAVDKAKLFRESYGGEVYESYTSLIAAENIDAVYVPLPPALHYKWAKLVAEHGKHILVEKPFTTSARNSKDLIETARKNNVAVHENYMFRFHSQLDFIKSVIEQGEIGEVRLYRLDFCFPFRGANDFRYVKELGGGALLDCGGYPIRLANILLGGNAKVIASQLNGKSGFDVDIYGNLTMQNADGVVAQISFGMDNAYKGSLEIIGSTGTLFASRAYTAPADFEPVVIVTNADGTKEHALPADDSFKKSIEYFYACVFDDNERAKSEKAILKQAEFIDAVGGK